MRCTSPSARSLVTTMSARTPLSGQSSARRTSTTRVGVAVDAMGGACAEANAGMALAGVDDVSSRIRRSSTPDSCGETVRTSRPIRAWVASSSIAVRPSAA